ncbi:MAG: hypothetical protein P0S95_03465 [Rhabdochlamydiaceae bacterium]|nr:hypothetical protein [Candidatus Amphrikana amoebophyrae]
MLRSLDLGVPKFCLPSIKEGSEYKEFASDQGGEVGEFTVVTGEVERWGSRVFQVAAAWKQVFFNVLGSLEGLALSGDLLSRVKSAYDICEVFSDKAGKVLESTVLVSLDKRLEPKAIAVLQNIEGSSNPWLWFLCTSPSNLLPSHLSREERVRGAGSSIIKFIATNMLEEGAKLRLGADPSALGFYKKCFFKSEREYINSEGQQRVEMSLTSTVAQRFFKGK